MATPFDSNLSTPEHQIDPPLKTGFTSSMVFAFAIHGLLVAALTWGVNWHQKAETTGVQAELWSAQSQESAPSAIAQNTPIPEQVEPPPPPPPQVEPEKKAEPIKTPVKPVEVNNEIKDAQIAIEKAKKEKLKQEIEQEKRLKEKKEKKEKEKAKAEQLEKEKQAEKDKLEQEKLDKAKANKEKEKLDKAKADKEKADKLAKTKADKAASDKARQEQINRLKNQAGAAGADSGTATNGSGKNNGSGTAAQSSGPSAGYEGRVRARLKPNIVFTENINGNPSTEIEVRLAQDGMVLGKPKILRSSGVKSWDDAVVRAIEKTEIFPRDIDGKVPPVIIMTLRPRE